MKKWKLMTMVLLSWGMVACAPDERALDCMDNIECGPGQACIDGECILPECRSDADCPAGASCVKYRCEASAECSQDGDCDLGAICVEGSCLPGCRNERDCSDGWICQENQCIQPGCRSDADCPQDTRCNAETGACDPTTKLIEGENCAVDDECDQAQGLLCDSQVECYGCMLVDPEFSPTFTCRYQCDLQVLTCPIEDRVCKYRHMGFVGLCIPLED